MQLNYHVFWLFMAIAIKNSSGTAYEDTVTVIIAASTPEIYTSGQFHTLSFYLNNTNTSAVFNESNTVFRFQPGSHEVNAHITVTGSRNIVWEGIVCDTGNQPLLQCHAKFGFMFENVFNLTLKHLDIAQCSRGHHFNRYFLSTYVQASLYLHNVTALLVHKIKASLGSGIGLLAVNVMGLSQIDSSTFSENGRNISLNYPGGNAIIVYEDMKVSSANPVLIIQNSHIHKGSDYCQEQERFRASGLGIRIATYRFKVNISVNNVTFFGNTGNLNHLSFYIKDMSGCANNISITNCTFHFEGTFKIERYSPDSQHDNIGRAVLTVESCTFYGGVTTGLDLGITVTDIDIKQTVIIKKCVFTAYKAEQTSNNAVIKVQQIGRFDGCPKTSLSFMDSIFQHNSMPCSYFNLTSSLYLKACPTVRVSNCTYSNNTALKDYLMLVERSNIPYVLKYEEDLINYGWLQHHVEVVNTSFIDNKISKHSYKGVVRVISTFISFSNCHFQNSVGTALQANFSVISLYGANQFINNTGKEGGAISLLKSRLHLNKGSHTTIENNKAEYGGGLFATPLNITKSGFVIGSSTCLVCTLSLPEYNMTMPNVQQVHLVGNIASASGHSVFYGAFTDCCVAKFKDTSTNLLSAFTMPNSHGQVSSPATELIWCGHSYSVDLSSIRIKTYPGSNFNISVKLGGDALNYPAVVATGRLCFDYLKSESHVCEYDYQNELRYGAGKQLVTNDCNNITYSVHSSDDKAFLETRIDRLNIEAPSISLNYKIDNNPPFIMAQIELMECPLGYQMANKPNEKPYCECVEYLLSRGLICDINQGGKVLRPERLWVGIYTQKLTVHNSCPFDYCVPNDKYISLSEPNEQCNHNHAGVLCGGCQANLSLALGSSKCKQCSNVYLLLIIPFALAGVALVILLLKCNLTVSTGHINGIIFYANIVHVNKALLFPKQGTAYVIFSMFIAWLNLDLGIETCFFENMDSYAKVWLQFVFPVYLWIMIGLIILSAHYSSRAGRLIGSNSVPVLATLFLLSYAKLLRTIIAATSFTFIVFEDSSYVTVWIPDSNIEYFSPKHTVLFLMALIFALAYILPLTLLVLLAPCLQAWSHHKVLNWVNKIKPFLDAYQGPYSNKFRFWTGLLLIARVILYIIFASNYDNDYSMNCFWINAIVGPLSILLCVNQRVYKQKLANFLEAFLLTSVTVLFAISWLTTTTGYSKWRGIREYATYISILLMALSLLFIVLYQFITTHLNCRKRMSLKRANVEEEHSIEVPVLAPTSTVVEIDKSTELKEPLLES